jgi:signal transduction histidine kinase
VRLPWRRAQGEAALLATSINTMAERIEKQFNDQRELLATVSHEIRTPLARVRLLVELARERGIDDDALGEIDREAVEMDALVSDLLASARLDFSVLAATSLDAIEMATRALDRAAVGRDRLDVPSGPVPLVADPTLVARALANLVQNAQTHGKGVTTMRVRREGDGVAFEVEDSGPGLDERDAAHLFEPFHRGARSESEKAPPGLGLGLALVRRIAEAHGGRAYARPRDGGGTVFGFTLQK